MIRNMYIGREGNLVIYWKKVDFELVRGMNPTIHLKRGCITLHTALTDIKQSAVSVSTGYVHPSILQPFIQYRVTGHLELERQGIRQGTPWKGWQSITWNTHTQVHLF